MRSTLPEPSPSPTSFGRRRATPVGGRSGRFDRQLVASWLGANLLLALWHPSLTGIGRGPLSVLTIGLTLVFVSGWGWSEWLEPSRGIGVRATLSATFSVAILVLTLGFFSMAGVAPTRLATWTALGSLTNLGFAGAFAAGRRARRPRAIEGWTIAVAAALFLASFATYYWMATRVVPPQLDQGLETQATGYGLATRFEPLLLTDRGTLYYFAHPPLVHFLVSGSFIGYGELAELVPYDRASRRARAARAGRPFRIDPGPLRLPESSTDDPFQIVAAEPPLYVVRDLDDGSVSRMPIEEVEQQRIEARFYAHPHRLETRTANLVLASATVALLALWAGKIGRRGWFGVLLAIAYGTTSEVAVRSSYGGYFAVDAFATLLILLAAERWRRQPTRANGGVAVAAGAFAALADHKLVLVALAVVLWRFFARDAPRDVPRGSSRALGALARRVLHPVGVGFALGTVAFWTWGLLINAGAFVQDHLRNHLLDRITHDNPLGYEGYPSFAALWEEFQRHTGWILLPAFLLAFLVDRRIRGRHREASALDLRTLCFLVALLTAAAFSLVDWRQTKHLAPILLPVFLVLTPPRGAPRWRVVASTVVLGAVLVWNVHELRLLATDFAAYPISPLW